MGEKRMKLQSKIEQIRSISRQPNSEAETRFQIVNPILDCLGWDHSDGTKVIPEFSVSDSRFKADYALLRTTNKPLVYIEVKNRSFSLTQGYVLQSHRKQVFGYAFLQGVQIIALTTGYKWWLYLPQSDGDADDRWFAGIDILEEQAEKTAEKLCRYLSYETLISGDAMSFAKTALEEVKKRKRMSDELPDVWNTILSDPPDDLVDIIKRYLHENDIQHYEDVIISFLKEKKSTIKPDKTLEPTSYKTKKQNVIQKNSLGTYKNSTPATYRLLGDLYEFKSWRKLWMNVAERVYKYRKSEFDWVVNKKHFIRTDHDKMKSYHRIPNSDYYIDLHASADQLVHRCKFLLEELGFSEEDLQIVYER